jgi:hypothetical protein
MGTARRGEAILKPAGYDSRWHGEVPWHVRIALPLFPGSELVPANLHTTAAPDGLTDVYIDQDKYGEVYAGGLSARQIRVAAATQRPITAQALADQATAAAPASTPKWEIVATEDHAVPTKVEEFMGRRAGATLVYATSGHDVPAAQPGIVDSVIAKAAAAAR